MSVLFATHGFPHRIMCQIAMDILNTNAISMYVVREIVLSKTPIVQSKNKQNHVNIWGKIRRAETQGDFWTLEPSTLLSCAWMHVMGIQMWGISTLNPTRLPRVKQNKQNGLSAKRINTLSLLDLFLTSIWRQQVAHFSHTEIHVLILKPRPRIENRSICYLFS